MQALVLTVHIVACLFLIILVLLQSGKEGMGVIFGGGSQSFFGSSGAGGILVKITAVCAGIFLVTSLAYNVLIGHRVAGGDSIMRNGAPAASAPAPEAKKPAVEFETSAPAKPAGEGAGNASGGEQETKQ